MLQSLLQFIIHSATLFTRDSQFFLHYGALKEVKHFSKIPYNKYIKNILYNYIFYLSKTNGSWSPRFCMKYLENLFTTLSSFIFTQADYLRRLSSTLISRLFFTLQILYYCINYPTKPSYTTRTLQIANPTALILDLLYSFHISASLKQSKMQLTFIILNNALTIFMLKHT